MNSLVCPFCNTPFDLPGLPGRVVCPRCGEAIPMKLLSAAAGPSIPATDRPAPVEVAPVPPARKPAVLFALVLLVASLAGLGIWYFVFDKKTDTIPTAQAPPPTRPPSSLPALKHLPPDTQILFAFQPPALIQYAERMGKKPEELLTEYGLPSSVFDGLAKAGIPLELIDHLAVGASVTDSLKLSVALFLRSPIEDEAAFRKAVNLRLNPDKPGQGRVDVPGFPVPMDLFKVDRTTYLFSTDDKSLAGMSKGQENLDYLKAGLRDSIRMLDPASFAWIATDNQNWAEVPTIKLIAGMLRQSDPTVRLKGVRALALGLSVSIARREVLATANVRLADAKAAEAFEQKSKAKAKLTDSGIELAVEKDWATLRLPESAYAKGLPAVLSLFDP